MLGIVREFALNDLVVYESMLYDAIGEEDAYYSVAVSFKYMGYIADAIETAYFIEHVITKNEYVIFKDYLDSVLGDACYNNMYDRMKVRDTYER